MSQYVLPGNAEANYALVVMRQRLNSPLQVLFWLERVQEQAPYYADVPDRIAEMRNLLSLPPASEPSAPMPSELARLAQRYPWPQQRPPVLPCDTLHAYDDGLAALTDALSDTCRIIVLQGLGMGFVARLCLSRAPHAYVIVIYTPEPPQPVDSAASLWPPSPTTYELFLTNCWHYRERIVLLPLPLSEALSQIKASDIRPDLIYLGAENEEAEKRLRHTMQPRFPSATVLFSRPMLRKR
jgi:hypothetical protein